MGQLMCPFPTTARSTTTAASEHPWAAILTLQLLTGEWPRIILLVWLSAGKFLMPCALDRPSSEPAISGQHISLSEY